MLHVAVFLAVGLPVMSLISLFGGVEPAVMLLTYAMTISTALFLAALGILISTFARRSREASAQVYILELAWLFGPSLVAQLMATPGLPWLDPLYVWARPVNDLLRWSSPVVLFEPFARADPINACFWMVGLQLGAAVVFVLLAIVAHAAFADCAPQWRRAAGGGLAGWPPTAAGRARFFPSGGR